MSNIVVRTPPQSPRKPKHSKLSCLYITSKRQDADLFEGSSMKPFAIDKASISTNNNSQFGYSARRDSGTTLDDASSIVERTYTASKIDSPISTRSRSSTKGSQGDLTNYPTSELSVSKSLATLTITPRESIYVRTLFRYDPSTDRSLPAKVS